MSRVAGRFIFVPKIQLEGLGKEDFGIVYGHFEILRSFGAFYDHLCMLFGGHLVYLSCFGMLYLLNLATLCVRPKSGLHKIVKIHSLVPIRFQMRKTLINFFCQRINI